MGDGEDGLTPLGWEKGDLQLPWLRKNFHLVSEVKLWPTMF